jgi:drug/metabolite transporter (DMT)-like permease
VWVALAITGVLASALAFTVQAVVQRKLSAVRAGIIYALEPLFAAICGYWLAGDRLKPLQVIGAATLLAAVVVAEVVPRWEQARRAARDAQAGSAGPAASPNEPTA